MNPLSQFWTLFLTRFRITLLFTFFILIWGLLAYKDIPREITPTIEIPSATIVTTWPGANPSDIEKLITNKIENKIKNLENVKEILSTSQTNVSVISVEFEATSDMTKNLQNLKEKIDNTKPDLPATLPDDPEVNEISISDVPILSLTISGDYAWSELKSFADIIEAEVEKVPLIKDISIKGAPKDEIHIFIDPVALQAHNLGIEEVASAIRAAHKDMPLGAIDLKGQKVEVSVQSEIKEASELLSLPIKNTPTGLITLKDIATVKKEYEKFEVETSYMTDQKAQPAVLVDIIKSASKGNVLTMVGNVLSRIEDLKINQRIPSHLDIAITYNRANDIKESLDTLTKSGLQTLILIGLLMFIALGWREALLSAFSIPLALLIAIVVLKSLGQTFNGVSLFALVLSIGLLVDNAIIIVEGISTGIHEKRLKPLEAALYTLKTFRWPIITGTLTTIFAFLPMLFFITGVSGQYISIVPITVTTVLIGALFVSLFLLPAISANFFRFIPPKKVQVSPLLEKSKKLYEKWMDSVLKSTKKTGIILGLSFGIFVFALSLVITSRVPIEVFPEANQTFFTGKAELPLGAKISDTRALIDKISTAVTPYFSPNENGEIWMRNIVYTVGKKSEHDRQHGQMNSLLPQENILGITFNLTPKEERKTASYTIMPLIEEAIVTALPPHVEFETTSIKDGPPTGSPIELRISGYQSERLETISAQLKNQIEALPQTTNIRDSISDKNLQITWRFDRAMMAQFGLTPAQVLEPLRSAINGITVIQITQADEEIDIDLRIDWEGETKWTNPETLEVIKQIPLKTPTGAYITFEQIATPTLESKTSLLEHRNGQRVIYVRSDLIPGVTASVLTPQIKEIMNQVDLLPEENIQIGGENEEGFRLMTESATAMLFALLLILVVLVWQFDSFYQAITTLVLIPLSLTGVFIGFWLTDLTITFPTMIGIVSLAGIIVNDAIVLIDRINHHHADNHWIEAYIQAGKERMQPIFLTSITTVVGMLPLSLSDEVWGGLGFAIVFGMTLSTVLTLVLIPCFLKFMPGKRGK